MRRPAPVLAIVLAITLAIGAVWTSPASAAAGEPDTTVSYPAPGQVVGAGPLTITGTATDNTSVSAVRIAIQHKTSRLWWRTDGTWGAWQQHPATLAQPNTATTTWSFGFNPATVPPGDNGDVTYNVQAEARDNTDQRDPTRAWQPFTIGLAPDTTVSYPAPGQVVGAGPLTITGTATDNTSVSAVRIAIQHKTSRLWWRTDGTWGAWQQHPATLAQPNTATTTWSFGFNPATVPPGDNGDVTYNVQAEARDNTDQRDPTRAWQPFTIGAPDEAFLTLLIGRSHWAVTDGSCLPLPGSVTLDRVAAAMSVRGLVATGAAVTPVVEETTRRCKELSLWSSWSDLAWLRDQHGWSFVPRTDVELAGLSPEQQYAKSCGLLDHLEAHGHARGWGLFAYQSNSWDPTAQADVVSTCFAFGRSYGWGRNTRTEMGPPWLQSTRSFNGGFCHDTTHACAQAPVLSTRLYDDPALLVAAFSPGTGMWNVGQFYQFVEGSRLDPDDDYNAWDCTSPDWRRHWTSRAELYCFNDFLSALDQIPDQVVVTDPAAVAEAWGRIPSTITP